MAEVGHSKIKVEKYVKLGERPMSHLGIDYTLGIHLTRTKKGGKVATLLIPVGDRAGGRV